METFSYYAKSEKDASRGLNACSIESSEYPFTVNCAGRFKTTFPFTTDNSEGRNDFYLLYLINGYMDVSASNHTFVASAGDAVIFAPHIGYKYVFGGTDHIEYLWVHFTGSYAQKFLDECGFSPLPYHKNIGSTLKISERFEKIFEIFEEKGPLQRHELAAALERLLLSIAKAASDNSDIPRALEKSIRYIHSSYNKKISVPELAAIENLSNSRYIALFHQQMGASPMAYIIALRMDAATDLLRNTDLSVKQIGILVGYHDPHFFSKLFKKYMGISPKEYKDKLFI